jgi:hypothetical protein
MTQAHKAGEPQREVWYVTSEDDYPTGQVSTSPLGNGDVCVTYGDRAKERARLIAAAPSMLSALKIAEAFMEIASDWNIDEAEINGEMRSTYDWLEVVSAAISLATGEGAAMKEQKT